MESKNGTEMFLILIITLLRRKSIIFKR